METSPLRRRVLFAGLYFAEGAPIGFVWWALPVWLRAEGWSPGEIANVLALLTWPWALKFLWAPLVDLGRSERFGIRSWILLAQLAMALTLGALLVFGGRVGSDLFVVLLVAHAVAAATQDASIDSLAIRSVPAQERGAINGWMQVGMLGGRALFGGGAVLLAGRLGYEGVLLLLLLAILAPAALLTLAPPESGEDLGTREERARRFRTGAKELFQRRELWLGLVVSSTVGASFEGTTSLAGALLLDHGASEELVGWMFLVPTVALMAIGALIGGRLSDRYGRQRSTMAAQASAALTVIAIGAAASGAPWSVDPWPFVALLGLLYLCAGAAIASLYALLMELTTPAFAATQFAVFMAGINLCYIWSTPVFGHLVEASGYAAATATLSAASLLAVPLIRGLTPRAVGA